MKIGIVLTHMCLICKGTKQYYMLESLCSYLLTRIIIIRRNTFPIILIFLLKNKICTIEYCIGFKTSSKMLFQVILNFNLRRDIWH